MKPEPRFDTLLTLTLPVALEDDVLDFLLDHPQWAGGYTVTDAHGMGRGMRLSTTMEQVQGRRRSKQVAIAGQEQPLRQLLAALAAQIPSSEVSYWLQPLTEFGRLA
ncbi:DUF3240 family protein [Pseudoduganella danionis]|uniref:DUF3240 domain-containing protein n=1 Tax=Pseudoduganella danionis TaxID=1890295 RepID=A0ABW9SV87_9BURK|nr:DUF3240 family protein [Pseudoduganella danionis]MTW34707.1 DUF3240 domain-containing protein [Pseudoduganella danionis]